MEKETEKRVQDKHLSYLCGELSGAKEPTKK